MSNVAAMPNRPASPLQRAVTTLGSQVATAQLLGVTQGAVSKWLQQGLPLPAQHVLTVEAATGISRHALRPDVYGPAPALDASRPATPADASSFEHAR